MAGTHKTKRTSNHKNGIMQTGQCETIKHHQKQETKCNGENEKEEDGQKKHEDEQKKHEDNHACNDTDEKKMPVSDVLQQTQQKLQQFPAVVNTVHQVTKRVPMPLMETLHANAANAIVASDKFLARAIDRYDLVHDQWFERVRDIGNQYPALKTSLHYVRYVSTVLQDQFLAALNTGKSLDKDEFVLSMQQSLGRLWYDALREPTEQFFNRAFAVIKSNPALSPRSSAKLVRSVFDEKTLREALQVPDAAIAMYHIALKQYIDLVSSIKDGQARASFAEFLESMKVRLGDAYTEKLNQPMRELYDRLSSETLSSLLQLHSHVDVDKNGEISIADVVATYRKSLDFINSRVQNSYHGFLQAAHNVVDRVIPAATPDDAASTLSIKGVGQHVTSNVASQLRNYALLGYRLAKNVSSERVCPAVGIDPVAFAESKLFATQEQFQHHIIELKNSLEIVQQRLNDLALKAAQTAHINDLSSRMQLGKDVAKEQFKLLEHRLSSNQRIVILQERVAATLVAIRELSSVTGSFVYRRQITRLPFDALNLLRAMPHLLLRVFLAKDNAASNIQPHDSELEQIIELVSQLLDQTRCLLSLSDNAHSKPPQRWESPVVGGFFYGSSRTNPIISPSTQNARAPATRPDLSTGTQH